MDGFFACITKDPFAEVTQQSAISIYAPALHGYSREIALATAMLPLGNLNAVTSERIASLADQAPKPAYCGIFVLDPFIQWTDFLAQIKSAGFRGVCNFPTLPEFGPEEEQALAASGFSFEHELEVLARFAEEGMDIAVVCPTQEAFGLARAKFQGREVPLCLSQNVDFSGI